MRTAESGDRPLPNVVERGYERIHLMGIENPIDAPRIEIRVGRFVEADGFHAAVLRKVIHDFIEELNLICALASPGKECSERVLRSLPIHPDQPAHEEPEPAA